MLAIPNTTTTPTDSQAGAAVFPTGGDAGSLTPYASGFLFVANNAAQISIRKGPTSGQAQWTPYTLVSPTMVPLSTDRGGRHLPDFIFGVKAIDGVAGTPAQVFGALFQAGEAGFIPSAQFAGTVATSGAFTPLVSTVGTLVAIDSKVAPIVIASAVEGAPTNIMDTGNTTWDGTKQAVVDLILPSVQMANIAGAFAIFNLWDGASNLGWLAVCQSSSGSGNEDFPVDRRYYLTPSAGVHNYRLRAWRDGGGGTTSVNAGAGGAGQFLNMQMRLLFGS